jgi:Ala-tRNA(Pro) deacylase
MAKAVMVRDGQGHAMVVIPGNTWVRLDLLNSDSGRAFRLDEESELKELFPDCEFGAVPVTGPAYGVETFVDEALASLSYVCFESGDHEHLVRVQGGDFAKLMSGVRHGHFARAE